MRSRAALAALASLGLAWPALALADDNDLVLSRLATKTMNGVVADNAQFRSLVSQLGVALAPRFLTPADTLGWSGFQFSADTSFTTIDNSAAYWRATEESGGGDTTGKQTSTLTTFGLFARKGLWLPIPSIELGAGATNLLGSSMWTAQAYAKFAVHEGYNDWPIPSLAARGAVSRLMGSEQLDLTIGSLDLSASKSFGLAGTVEVTPYGGWNYLWMIPRSEVIDKTPDVDVVATPTDLVNNFVFSDQDNIIRQRLFVGLKLKYYVFAFSAEAVLALAGSSVDDKPGVGTTCSQADAANKNNCDAEDTAAAQQTYTFSLSMDF